MKGCCEVAAMFQQVCLDCNTKVKRARKLGRDARDPGAPKNLCGKMRPKSNPYEVWQAGSWTWQVLKKWQADDDKSSARWFCNVITPMVPRGEMGDVYVAEIKQQARRIA